MPATLVFDNPVHANGGCIFANPEEPNAGSGTIQPGGFRIGFYQDYVRNISRIPELRIDIPPIRIQETSKDYAAEFKRIRTALELLEEMRQRLDMMVDMDASMRKFEQANFVHMSDELKDGLRMLEIIRKRRLDEEELITILMIDE